MFNLQKVKKVILDGKETWKLQCPKCQQWGYLDDDQFNGRISTQCECGFHETINFKKSKKSFFNERGRYGSGQEL